MDLVESRRPRVGTALSPEGVDEAYDKDYDNRMNEIDKDDDSDYDEEGSKEHRRSDT